jgi:hypothetical protein
MDVQQYADPESALSPQADGKQPPTTEQYTVNGVLDREGFNQATDAFIASWEPSDNAEVVLVDSSSGRLTRMTSEQIDAEIEFDQAKTTQEAIATEAKCRRLEATVQIPTRDRAPRRASIGIRRRTCGARRRPGGTRRVVRSSSGASDSESDSDGPGEARHVFHVAPVASGVVG